MNNEITTFGVRSEAMLCALVMMAYITDGQPASVGYRGLHAGVAACSGHDVEVAR